MNFSRRFEFLVKSIYSSAIPSTSVGDDRGVIHTTAGEIWATFGGFDRLTNLVLAAHRFRLGASISAVSGFSVRITSLGHHPENPVEHHPGLGDLVASCYKMGGRKSDAELLQDASRILLQLTNVPGVPEEWRLEGIRLFDEIRSR